ncbi:MAG: hypothetical protein JJE25_03380 [Bacteroidia bacterium]|nr:hypothetical protein [Bacteroidia bacterium]
MLIRFFRTSHPSSFLTIPFIALLWWIPFFLNHPESFIENPQHTMPLYEWIFAGINKLPVVGQLILSWLIISAQAIYLNQFVLKYELFPRPGFLPALFFITFYVLFPEMMRIQPSLFVNLILLIVLDKIFLLYKNAEPFGQVFNSSFLLAVATFIDSSSVIFYIFFLLSLITLLPLYWRIWLISFIGFVLPYYFISVYFFWTDSLGDFWQRKIPESFSYFQLTPLNFSVSQIVLFSFIFLLLFFSIRSVTKHFYKNIIRTRRYFQIIFILLFTAGISLFIGESIHLKSTCVMVIPLSLLFGYYFHQIKKGALSEFLYLIFIALIIIVRLP